MGNSICVRLACVSAAALLAGLGVAGQANAGSFSIREQSSYFQGSGFAGNAAGGDISSMFWNSAAVASLPGFNVEASGTIISLSGDLAATNGLLYTPLAPTANIGTDAFVPAMYGTYQVNDRLYAGIAVNSPFGLITKPDNLNWAGSPIATTTKTYSLNFNPTIAYKITPEVTVGVGAQAEYFRIRLNKSSFDVGAPLPASGERHFDANGWGAGATAGIIWQPTPFTSLGLGYRSAVSEEIQGVYNRQASLSLGGATAEAKSSLTLPDEFTFSVRQAVTNQLTLLGTVEWQNWSRLGNVSAVGVGCVTTGGVCETLNLNYRDGWYFAGGVEYAYSPSLLLRTGVNYEISPIDNSNRNILIPDANRIGVSVGGSYRYSDRVTFDLAYTHLFIDNAPWCVAAGATTHCVSATSPNVLLAGTADDSADILSFGAKYSTGAPVAALEPYKK
jgi:long-chain fatty acid transport protein